MGSNLGIQDKSRFDEIMKFTDKIDQKKKQLKSFLEKKEEEYESLLNDGLKKYDLKMKEFVEQMSKPHLLNYNSISSFQEIEFSINGLLTNFNEIEKSHLLLKEFW